MAPALCRGEKNGISGHQTASSHKEQLGATISLDYCFVTPLEKTEDMCAALVMYDNWMEALWALPVKNKGLVKHVVDWCVDTLGEAGYRGERITLNSDDGPAMVALKKAVAATRKGGTPLIDTPVRESNANGAVDGAIRIFQGQVRTFRHQHEYRPGMHGDGKTLSTEHPIMTWLVTWTNHILFKFTKNVFGRSGGI